MSTSRKVRLTNPALLNWARESAGFSVQQMADSLRKKSENILAWEIGRDSPTFRQLEEFAHKVNRSVAALYLPEPPAEPPLPHDYRCLPDAERGSFGPEARLAFRELRNATARLVEVLEALGRLPGFDLPEGTLEDDPADVAHTVRQLLGVDVAVQSRWRGPYAALDGWSSVLFEHAVLVQQFPVEVEQFRGFSLLEERSAGIGISSKDAPVARVFSIFHEVAHLCLRRPGVSADVSRPRRVPKEPVEQLEKYCDRFAAAFLLPSDEPEVLAALEGLAGRLKLDPVEQVASRFKVSKYVIARRMLDLGLVDSEQYWSTWSRWRQEDRLRRASGGRAQWVPTKVSHSGKRYVSAVLEALDRGLLTLHDVGSLVDLAPGHLDEARRLVASVGEARG